MDIFSKKPPNECNEKYQRFEVNVTDLVRCSLCARLFYYDLKDDKKKKKMGHGGDKSGPVPGVKLHSILKKIHEKLSNEANSLKFHELLLLSSDNRKNEIIKLISDIEDCIIDENPMTPQDYEPIERSLKAWKMSICAFFCEELDKNNDPNISFISDMIQPVKLLSCEYQHSNNVKIEVRGEPDTLFISPADNEYVIWEFKGMEEVNENKMLMQITLYAWLIKQETGISSRAMGFVFGNDVKRFFYGSDIINTIIDEKLPVLFERYLNVLSAINSHNPDVLPFAVDSHVCNACQYRNLMDCEHSRTFSFQKLLHQHNPFLSLAITSRDIWNSYYPDVESIHQDAYDQIIHLVQEKQKTPDKSIGILVLGEAGSGKTHLMMRIARDCLQEGTRLSLVTVPPSSNSNSIQHLTHSIFTGLHDEFKGISTPLFQRLIQEILRDSFTSRNSPLEKIERGIQDFFAYHEAEQGKVDTLSGHLIDWILQQDATLDREFLHVLLQVCNKSRRRTAIQWMMGETLDEDDANLLALPVDSDTHETSPITETKAQTHLITLGRLLSKYNLTLFVCFDQLEVWHDQHMFGITVQTLLQIPAILPLIFSCTTLWNEFIARNASSSLLDILSPNTIILHGCNKEQIEELIKTRIQHELGDEWEEPYNWLIQELYLRQDLPSNPTPGEVFVAANRILSIKY